MSLSFRDNYILNQSQNSPVSNCSKYNFFFFFDIHSLFYLNHFSRNSSLNTTHPYSKSFMNFPNILTIKPKKVTGTLIVTIRQFEKWEHKSRPTMKTSSKSRPLICGRSTVRTTKYQRKL